MTRTSAAPPAEAPASSGASPASDPSRSSEAASSTEPGWAQYAALLIERAALIQRAVRGRPADDLAGLRLSDQDIRDALAPASGPGDEDAAAALDRIDQAYAPALRAAEMALMAALYDESPWSDIVEHSQLTVAEACALALLTAVENEVRLQRLVAYLNDDVTARWLTPHVLRAIGDDDAALVRAVGPSGGLRRAALLSAAADGPWASAAIRLHPQVMWRLVGDDALGDALPAGSKLLRVAGRGEEDFVLVSGPDRVRRLQAIVDALSGNGFLVVPAPEADQWDPIVRYASLSGAAVVVECEGELPAHAADRIAAATQLSWAVTSAVEQPLRALPPRPWRQLAAAPAEASADELAAALGEAPDASLLLSAEQLQSVASATAALDGDVTAAVRRLAAGGIDRVADRIVPRRTWDDLVVAAGERDLLQEIVTRTRHRHQVFGDWKLDAASSGVLALFSGPSGTGKTLAAEVVAHQLGLDLYRIDLSRIVDKYIGETEKKLAEVFDAAQASPMVLFLDEADALVGKRTDVSDAHDRYANIEVAYLLQRLETHSGIVIFASNFAGNIDQAFVRRIHVSVQFALPQAPERLLIWQRSVPGAVPRGDINWQLLADGLELSGGQIRNIAVRAAFLAAEEGSELRQDHLVESAAREMRKAGRIFPSSLLV